MAVFTAVILAIFTLCAVSEAGKFRKRFYLDSTKPEWTVYDHESFDQNDLCLVLNCKEHELCLVKRSSAMCLNKHKLHKIEGKITHFQKKTSGKAGDDFQVIAKIESPHVKPYDADRVEAKWRKHLEDKLSQREETREKSVNGQKVYLKKQKKVKQHKSHDHQERKHVFPERSCSQKELQSIGARLLQWFTDVHRVENTAVAALPSHHVRCRADVGWMFQKLDGDENGELSVEELRSLEDDKYEHCIKPFLDRCDVREVDDVLTLDEWCDCFEWSDHDKQEPPCHKDLRTADPHLLGVFKPRCDVDGYYRPEQCHERRCWCVDKLGREFDQSRVRGRADCAQYAETNPDDEDLNDEDEEGSGKEL